MWNNQIATLENSKLATDSRRLTIVASPRSFAAAVTKAVGKPPSGRLAMVEGAQPARQGVAKNDVLSPTERDWALFVDWCRAVGVTPVPAKDAQLRRFLLEVPASPAAARRRLRAIDAAHVALGLAAPSEHLKAPVSRFDPIRVAATLDLIPIGGWPAGIVGRRDAALVALICTGGLTRRHVRSLCPASSETPVLAPAVEPGACPACAVSRWLRVHALAAAAGWRAARGELADIGEVPARDEVVHDCARPIRWPDKPGRWPMFSAIDRHGWVNEAVPLSVRSITTVVACRLDEGERRSGRPVAVNPGGPAHVQGTAPSSDFRRGLRARQEANQRLAELEAMIEVADMYAESVLDHLEFP